MCCAWHTNVRIRLGVVGCVCVCACGVASSKLSGQQFLIFIGGNMRQAHARTHFNSNFFAIFIFGIWPSCLCFSGSAPCSVYLLTISFLFVRAICRRVFVGLESMAVHIARLKWGTRRDNGQMRSVDCRKWKEKDPKTKKISIRTQ